MDNQNIFSMGDAKRYLAERGVGGLMNFAAKMRRSEIFMRRGGAYKVERYVDRWEWRIFRWALDEYIVWWHERREMERWRTYHIRLNEAQYHQVVEVLGQCGLPIPVMPQGARGSVVWRVAGEDEGGEGE